MLNVDMQLGLAALRSKTLTLAMSLEMQKHYEEAVVVYTKSLEALEDPGAQILERLAVLEYNLKRWPDALQHFEMLIVRQPDHPRRAEFDKVMAVLRARVDR